MSVLSASCLEHNGLLINIASLLLLCRLILELDTIMAIWYLEVAQKEDVRTDSWFGSRYYVIVVDPSFIATLVYCRAEECDVVLDILSR